MHAVSRTPPDGHLPDRRQPVDAALLRMAVLLQLDLHGVLLGATESAGGLAGVGAETAAAAADGAAVGRTGRGRYGGAAAAHAVQAV